MNPFGVALEPAVDPGREVAGLMLFVGNFRHHPNVDAALWLAREILPEVAARRDEARLRIVGTAPPAEVAALAGDRVEVVADAASVRPHLEQAAVVLAPVRTGGGMRMKVLEALAAGKAVVTTERGAEGFTEFEEAPPMAIADDPVSIAEAAAELLDDDRRRRTLGERARRFAVAHHGPDAWAARTTAVYEEAIARRAGDG